MKRSRFNEEEVIGILREGEGGSSVKAVCAKHNISEATYYAWKRKFGGMDVSEARRFDLQRGGVGQRIGGAYSRCLAANIP